MPGKFAERKLPPYAVLKAEHDAEVERLGRPFTQEPPKRKSVEDKAAPDLSDDWFGVMPSRSVPAQVKEAS